MSYYYQGAIGGGPPPSWSPTDESSLFINIDYSLQTSLNETYGGGGSQPSNGDPIRHAEDQSGNDYHVGKDEANALYVPELETGVQNGLSVANFTNSGFTDHQVILGSAHSFTGVSIFIAGIFVVTSTEEPVIVLGPSGMQPYDFGPFNGSAMVGIGKPYSWGGGYSATQYTSIGDDGTNFVHATGTTISDATTFKLLELHIDCDSMDLEHGEDSSIEDTAAGGQSNTSISMQKLFYGRLLTSIGEIMIFDEEADATLRSNVRSYFDDKWAIAGIT